MTLPTPEEFSEVCAQLDAVQDAEDELDLCEEVCKARDAQIIARLEELKKSLCLGASGFNTVNWCYTATMNENNTFCENCQLCNDFIDELRGKE